VVSVFWFTMLIAAVAVERVVELVVSRRHLRWAKARGGMQYGRGHYPFMVAVHVGLLGGALIEVWLAGRPFIPVLGVPMIALVLASQALRWWCVRTLGPQWNTLVVIVPGLPLVGAGPYRWLRHPNYVAVVVEGFALPLVHTAWLTALLFAVANGVVLAVRIRVENTALAAVRT
jgi:methyltransferase